MEEFHAKLRNNTAVVRAHSTKLGDIVAWWPNLERWISELGEMIADLHQGCTSAAMAPGAEMAGDHNIETTLTGIGGLPGVANSMQELPHRSDDHEYTFVHWEKAPVTTPVPLPGIG